MYKMNKLYSFHISKNEQDALREIRKNKINVSEYLRNSLSDLGKELRSQKIVKEKNKDLTCQVISNLLLWLQKESLS